MDRYIAYYRVSTQKQGKLGLGLKTQWTDVQRFVNDSQRVLAEYTDVESREEEWST